jgi:predicted small lipoprotein YifL
MRRGGTTGIVILAATLAGLAACGPRGPKAPGREVVTPLLQKEANDLKTDGEKLDPVLGVKATWAIAGIDVTERANDPDRPWAGTIRFKIRSETKDTDGAVLVDEFDRSFDYVYSATLGKWIFQLPPSPAPEP